MAKLFSYMLGESMENVKTETGVVTHLIGPTVSLRPQYIPGNFSFSMSIGITDMDLTRDNMIEVKVQRPSGEWGGNLGVLELRKNNLPADMQPGESGIVLNADIRNYAFPEEGIYKIHVELNGEMIGVCNVPVYRGG